MRSFELGADLTGRTYVTLKYVDITGNQSGSEIYQGGSCFLVAVLLRSGSFWKGVEGKSFSFQTKVINTNNFCA